MVWISATDPGLGGRISWQSAAVAMTAVLYSLCPGKSAASGTRAEPENNGADDWTCYWREEWKFPAEGQKETEWVWIPERNQKLLPDCCFVIRNHILNFIYVLELNCSSRLHLWTLNLLPASSRNDRPVFIRAEEIRSVKSGVSLLQKHIYWFLKWIFYAVDL